MPPANFHQVLELAESLSESEQDFLIEILQKRLSEKRRKEIAESIVEAHAEYKQGKTQPVTVDDLMADKETRFSKKPGFSGVDT
ncbi:MAG: hypothetical protein P5702_11240 [Limnospira sp. PMC 1291.21]|uniref:Uncharacterized protein n=3 Tax=Limnospira TaxID=2596745 RepID=A0A9P1KLR8_9CYAN|nr:MULTISPECIES: hypothetical protein [Limnospira]EKD08857.1 hypothetical protein SPLC1_S202580 [Arthrospira platensis C1]MDC0837826.1 hypothetical protein [Limnoraphis robusta]MDY7053758.1 hypothetical protein [Limnospira fusiformis LS22]QJB29283.1 hypothetical protein HFV01_29960 [Limnospira fusiformis SAG 85.79]EDZ95247.1 hypothetical protein AmaxDRAFT_1848 [Limnospira maxima CS-328]